MSPPCSSLRRTRPGTRALAVDWTAWGGIGMATRGSIPKIMEMLKPVWGVYGAEKQLRSRIFDGPHNFPDESRAEAIGFKPDEYAAADIDQMNARIVAAADLSLAEAVEQLSAGADTMELGDFWELRDRQA